MMTTVHIPEWGQDLPSFRVGVDPQRTHVGVGDAGGSASPRAGEWAALSDGQAGGPWRNRDAAMPEDKTKGIIILYLWKMWNSETVETEQVLVSVMAIQVLVSVLATVTHLID